MAMRDPLTPKQYRLIAFIGDYTERHGYPPSFGEIGAEFEYRSISTVHEHIKNLVRKGYLRRSVTSRDRCAWCRRIRSSMER